MYPTMHPEWTLRSAHRGHVQVPSNQNLIFGLCVADIKLSDVGLDWSLENNKPSTKKYNPLLYCSSVSLDADLVCHSGFPRHNKQLFL